MVFSVNNSTLDQNNVSNNPLAKNLLSPNFAQNQLSPSYNEAKRLFKQTNNQDQLPLFIKTLGYFEVINAIKDQEYDLAFEIIDKGENTTLAFETLEKEILAMISKADELSSKQIIFFIKAQLAISSNSKVIFLAIEPHLKKKSILIDTLTYVQLLLRNDLKGFLNAGKITPSKDIDLSKFLDRGEKIILKESSQAELLDYLTKVNFDGFLENFDFRSLPVFLLLVTSTLDNQECISSQKKLVFETFFNQVLESASLRNFVRKITNNLMHQMVVLTDLKIESFKQLLALKDVKIRTYQDCALAALVKKKVTLALFFIKQLPVLPSDSVAHFSNIELKDEDYELLFSKVNDKIVKKIVQFFPENKIRHLLNLGLKVDISQAKLYVENSLFSFELFKELFPDLTNSDRLSDHLKELFKSHFSASPLLNVNFLRFCLLKEPDLFNSFDLKRLNYRSGDLQLLIREFPSSFGIERFNPKKTDSNLKFLADFYKINPHYIYEDGDHLLHFIAKSSRSLDTFFSLFDETSNLSDLFQLDHLSLTPLDYLKEFDFSNLETLENLGTYSQFFNLSKHLPHVFLTNSSVFEKWMVKEPHLLEHFKRPLEFSNSKIDASKIEAKDFPLFIKDFTAQELSDLTLRGFNIDETNEEIYFNGNLLFEPFLSKSKVLKNSRNETILWTDSTELVKVYLDFGVDPTVISSDECNFLHHLFRSINFKESTSHLVTKIFLDYPQLRELIFKPDNTGVTPFDVLLNKYQVMPKKFYEFIKPIDISRAVNIYSVFAEQNYMSEYVELFPDFLIEVFNYLIQENSINECELLIGILNDPETKVASGELAIDRFSSRGKQAVFNCLNLLQRSINSSDFLIFISNIFSHLKFDPSDLDAKGSPLIYSFLKWEQKDIILSSLKTFDCKQLTVLGALKLYSITNLQEHKELALSKIGETDDLESIVGKIKKNRYPLEEDYPLELFSLDLNLDYIERPVTDCVIPDKKNTEDFDQILTLFDENVLSKDLSFVIYDDDKEVVTKETVKFRLETLVGFIKIEKAYAGVPETKHEFYCEIKLLLSLIVDLLKQEKDLDRIQSALVDIGVGGPEGNTGLGHCGARWKFDLLSHFRLLSNQMLSMSPEQLILQRFSETRSGIYYDMIKNKGFNIHYALKLYHLIGDLRKIPHMGNPLNDTLGHVDRTESLIEFDSLHHEYRVFKDLFDTLNDPFLPSSQREAFEDLLKTLYQIEPLAFSFDTLLNDVESALAKNYLSLFETFPNFEDGLDIDDLFENNPSLLKTSDLLLEASKDKRRVIQQQIAAQNDLKALMVQICEEHPEVKSSKDLKPHLERFYQFKSVKSILQEFPLSDEAIYSYIETKTADQLKEALKTSALVVQRNELLKTLYEQDDNCELITYLDFNRPIPHFKASVILDILKYFKVLKTRSLI